MTKAEHLAVLRPWVEYASHAYARHHANNLRL